MVSSRKPARWIVTPNGAYVCQGLGVVMSVREDGIWYAYPSERSTPRLGPFDTAEDARAALEAAYQDDEP